MDKFYVYAYLDPDGIPFYIGKGCDKRRDNHARLCRHKETENECRRFYAKLREMIASGTRYEVIDVLESLPLTAARLWEKCLIDEIGRLDLGTGPLTNLKSGETPGPETRRLMGKATAAQWAALDPEERQRRLDALTQGFERLTPEERQRNSKTGRQVQLEQWAALDPEERQRRSRVNGEAISAGHAAMTPEEKKHDSEAKSKATTARWAKSTTEEKNKHTSAGRKAIKVNRAKMTPEEKKAESEKKSQAAKAWRAKKKAAKST